MSRPPRCPVTTRASFSSESGARAAAAARDPWLAPVDCEHCPHWHYAPPPGAHAMTRLQRAVILALLASPGTAHRGDLREIAAASAPQGRTARAGGGRRSTNELRALLASLERDNLVIRSESTVTVLDAEALRNWTGGKPAAPDEEAPCPSSSPQEDR